MATLHLDIVTAERLVYSEEVDVVVAPGIEGDLAVLPRHTLLLTVLRTGEIRVVKDGEESYIAVSGGFLEVMANKITVLADTAERTEEIDLQRAEEALESAREHVASADSDLDLERAMIAIRRSQARLKAARRRGTRPRGGVPGLPSSE